MNGDRGKAESVSKLTNEELCTRFRRSVGQVVDFHATVVSLLIPTIGFAVYACEDVGDTAIWWVIGCGGMMFMIASVTGRMVTSHGMKQARVALDKLQERGQGRPRTGLWLAPISPVVVLAGILIGVGGVLGQFHRASSIYEILAILIAVACIAIIIAVMEYLFRFSR